MPKLIRLNPPWRSFSRYDGSTDSGLASVVTSAPGASPNSESIAARILARSSGGSRVGVPPPKNTVSTGSSVAPRTRRARRISVTTVSA